LTDKSSPEEILEELHLSKKAFKKAIGVLYKKKKIKLEKDRIVLLSIKE
jgi:predicted RNA-binding protein (virulence factor B family)